jgi:thiamine biosynthesis lipoprotein
MKRLIIVGVCLILSFSLWGCSTAGEGSATKPSETQATEPAQTSNKVYERSEFIYGTLVHVKLFESGSEAVLDSVFQRLMDLDQMLSTTVVGSDVYKVNAAAGIEPIKVSEETYFIIERSLDYSDMSKGRFDITIEPLVVLWDIGGEGARIPAQSEIDAVLPLVDYKKIELDKVNRTVYLPEIEMGIDLGAIAKGYAADEVIRLLKEADVKKAIVNLGGNVIVLGRKSEEAKWVIGIQNPESNRGEYLGIAKVADQTVVTSGIYERYFEQDGKRYHHLLDTLKGYPVESNLASVSIIADVSIDADALSTAVFTLGIEEGLKLIETISGAEAIFVTKDRKLYSSSGIQALFELTDTNFEWVTQ